MTYRPKIHFKFQIHRWWTLSSVGAVHSTVLATVTACDALGAEAEENDGRCPRETPATDGPLVVVLPRGNP